MNECKSIAEWMSDRGMTLHDLLRASLLDRKVVEAIIQGRYTPSPKQRVRLAAALGVEPEAIAWGHTIEVQHIYGHGPQFGRSP
jgi:transcriptional regulator with XRE-family HTH domain